MFRTPSPKDSLSVALRKLFQGGRSRSQAIYKFATKGASSLNIKDWYLSTLCFWRWKPLASLNSFLSYAPSYLWPNPVSLFTWLLGFSQLLSNQHGWWQHPLDHSFGRPHSHLEARNCWWLWHFLFIMAADIFTSQGIDLDYCDVEWLALERKWDESLIFETAP